MSFGGTVVLLGSTVLCEDLCSGVYHGQMETQIDAVAWHVHEAVSRPDVQDEEQAMEDSAAD